jgi:thiol-disulfide isomerase/thioredoxin
LAGRRARRRGKFKEFGMRGNGWRLRVMKGLAICFCGMLFAGSAVAGTPGEIPAGSLLPEAELNGLVGSAGKLSAFRGKPLLINVWASWCGPCRDEMGSLERLSRRYGGKAFNVVGISTDDDHAAAAKFVKVSGVSFPNYIDRNLVLENMLGANRLPLTVLVDGEGRVIKKISGSRAWDSPEAINLITQAFRLKAL